MKAVLIGLLIFITTAFLNAQYYPLEFKCYYTPGDTILHDEPGINPLIDTKNMTIVLCIEKGQYKNVDIAQFLIPFKENLEDYFDKASFGNYQVNVLDFLVESKDTIAGIATLFELPDTIVMYPKDTTVFGMDTSFVVRPWMVRNILF